MFSFHKPKCSRLVKYKNTFGKFSSVLVNEGGSARPPPVWDSHSGPFPSQAAFAVDAKSHDHLRPRPEVLLDHLQQLARSCKVRRAKAATRDTQDQPLILCRPSGHQEGSSFPGLHKFPARLHFPSLSKESRLKFPKLRVPRN